MVKLLDKLIKVHVMLPYICLQIGDDFRHWSKVLTAMIVMIYLVIRLDNLRAILLFEA